MFCVEVTLPQQEQYLKLKCHCHPCALLKDLHVPHCSRFWEPPVTFELKVREQSQRGFWNISIRPTSGSKFHQNLPTHIFNLWNTYDTWFLIEIETRLVGMSTLTIRIDSQVFYIYSFGSMLSIFIVGWCLGDKINIYKLLIHNKFKLSYADLH